MEANKVQKIDEKYFKNPEAYIPKGSYCYDVNGKCPFWAIDETKPAQESGYCHLLKQGDWHTNQEGGILLNPKTGEERKVDYFPFGLLWDQVKECDINDEEE